MVAQALRSALAGAQQLHEIELGERVLELSARVNEDGATVMVHDITERRRLRAFGSGVLQGAEEERQRIARELHDDTAQSLAALVLRLQMARRSDDPETRERMLRELHEDIHRASLGPWTRRTGSWPRADR